VLKNLILVSLSGLQLIQVSQFAHNQRVMKKDFRSDPSSKNALNSSWTILSVNCCWETDWR